MAEMRTEVSQKRQATWDNKVCIYWRQGRCNRNPCRFLHREVQPSQTTTKPTKRGRTWRNPDYDKSMRKTTDEQPKQCKYWVTGNCVHGDKCKDLHSWFSGSGFTMVAKLEGHTKPITGISQPSGCHKLCSGSKDGSLRVWDCNTGQCTHTIELKSKIGCLAGEGPWVFTGLENNVKGWNFEKETEFSLPECPVGSVTSMVVDEDLVFAGMEDGRIMMWKWNSDSNIHEPAHVLKGHHGAVCCFVIGAGRRLYSGSRDSTIKVWDLNKMECLQTLEGHSREVTSVLCWSNFLISASLDKTLKVWGTNESGAIEMTYETRADDLEVLGLCGIIDGEEKPILLCTLSDSTVRLYDLPSLKERGRIFSKRPVQVIQLGIDGIFFTGDTTGDVSVWKLDGAPSPFHFG